MSDFVDLPVPEPLFSDDARLIAEMLGNQWSLGVEDRPDIFGYVPEMMMVNARLGAIYIYHISRRNSDSSIDYRTLRRTSRLGIKIDTRNRDTMFRWCDEIYRILMANRRVGVHRHGEKRLGDNTYLEVLGERPTNDLSGWYTTTFDIQLTSYATPIRSSGFGNNINREIDDMTNEGDSQ